MVDELEWKEWTFLVGIMFFLWELEFGTLLKLQFVRSDCKECIRSRRVCDSTELRELNFHEMLKFDCLLELRD